MDTATIGKLLLAVGLALAGIGLALWLAGRLGITPGSLPGDLHWKSGRWTVYFPLGACIVGSIILTLLLALLIRFFH
jgi:hypothetical protein